MTTIQIMSRSEIEKIVHDEVKSAIKINVEILKRIVEKSKVDFAQNINADLSKHWDELGLSNRVSNAIRWHSSIQSIGQLQALSENELSTIRNIGKKAIFEIKTALNNYGLEWPLNSAKH